MGFILTNAVRGGLIGLCIVGNQASLCVGLQGGFSMFIQLMPIVVLILVSLLSQMMVSPPPYSLYSRQYVNFLNCCTLLSVISIQHVEIAAAVNTLSSSRSTGQTVKRQTENLHVDYYVTRDFKSEYKASALQQIEKNVEEDYVSNIRNNCWKERQTS